MFILKMKGLYTRRTFKDFFKYFKAVSLCAIVALVVIWHNTEVATKQARKRCEAVIKESHSYQDNRQCHAIAATNLLLDYNYPQIEGKIMKSIENPRELTQFLANPQDITSISNQCQHLKDHIKWKIVFFVKSSAGNFGRREAIRNTWGSVKVYRSALIKVIFVIGSSNNKIKSQLEQEIIEHKDILQMDLEESSRIIPEKVIAAMQWSWEHLSSEWIHASLDDDIVVLMPNLIDYLDTMFHPVFNTTAGLSPCYEDLPIICVYSYQQQDVPARNPKVKWFISKEDYPNDKWPAYCRGGLYLMSNKLASDLFSVSRTTPRLYLDDVWITGLMRRKLNFGDCNIIAAPYSRQSDRQLQSIQPAPKEHLVKHLWGNIQDKPVDVDAKLIEEWMKWKKKITWDKFC